MALPGCEGGGADAPDPDAAVRTFDAGPGDARLADPADGAPDGPAADRGLPILDAELPDRGERDAGYPDSAPPTDAAPLDAALPDAAPPDAGPSPCDAPSVLAIDAPVDGRTDTPGRLGAECGFGDAFAWVEFTAPEAGVYLFTLEGELGSAFSLQPACGPGVAEVPCRSVASPALPARLTEPLDAGQTIWIAVIGEAPDPFRLTVAPHPCPLNMEERQRCVGDEGIPGVQNRWCDSGGWSPWSECFVTGVCVPETVQGRACQLPDRPAREARVCDEDGRWQPWSECEELAPCFDGRFEDRPCDIEGLYQRSVCDAEVGWVPIGVCQGGACPAPVEAHLGVNEGRLPVGAPSRFEGSCRAEHGAGLGSEAVSSFRAERTGTYVFWAMASGDPVVETLLYLRDQCDDPASERACFGDERYFADAFLGAIIRHDMQAGEEVTVFVDGHRAGGGGAYVLDIALRPIEGCEEEPVGDNSHPLGAVPFAALRPLSDKRWVTLDIDLCEQPDHYVEFKRAGCFGSAVGVERTSFGQRPTLRVFRPAGSVRRADFDSSAGLVLDPPGPYTFAFEPREGESPQSVLTYFQCIRPDPAELCADEWFDEGDAGADRATAVRLTDGEDDGQLLCPGDDDVFVFEGQPGCIGQLLAGCDAGVPAEITAVDGAGAPLATHPLPSLSPWLDGVVARGTIGPDGVGPSVRIRPPDGAPSAAYCDVWAEQYCLDFSRCGRIGTDTWPVGRRRTEFGVACDAPVTHGVELVAGCVVHGRLDPQDADAGLSLTLRRQGDPAVLAGGATIAYPAPVDGLYDLEVVAERPGQWRYALDIDLDCPNAHLR